MRIHHIAISVKSLIKSAEFYKDIFGFIEVKKFEKKELGGKAMFLKLKDTQIELWQFDKQVKNKDDFRSLNVLGLKHIAFEVSNIEKEYRKMKGGGIKISKPKLGASGAKYLFLKDPDGLPIELYEKL
jgi:glyoxylase I family protein